MQLRRSVAAAAALLLGVVPLAGQTRLPDDPAIRSGTLASGLRYFLMTSPVERNRVIVQLVVKAGSVDEADDQRGVAHLLEHMAFNGSTHFKSGEVMSYFKAVDPTLDTHVNAATTFDATHYFLDVPVAQDAAVTRAFAAVRDVADGLTLDEAELDRERRVVIEEWRRRLGPQERQRTAYEGAWFAGSRYADRGVLGDADRMAAMPIAAVRRFYRDHYHPDRMALVVVGGLPVASLEARVHEAFDSLRANPSPPRSVPETPQPIGTRYAAFSDPAVRSATVDLMFVNADPPLRTTDDLRGFLLRMMSGAMMGVRLTSQAAGTEAPFRSAAVRPVHPLLNTEVTMFSAAAADGQTSEALSAMLREVTRAREHGFTDLEVWSAGRAAAAAFQQLPRSNRAIVSELERHFLRDEPTPSPAQLTTAAQAALVGLNTDVIRAAIKNSWSDTNRVIASSMPAAGGAAAITETTLRQVAATVDALPALPPWQLTLPVRAAATALPPAGTVTSRREEKDSGITVLTLSNGAVAWLKPLVPAPGTATPSPVAPDVELQVWAPGGTSLASSSDRAPAQLAPQLITGAGVGGMTPDQRAQALRGRPVRVGAFVTATAHGVTGQLQTRELETAFNLVHLHFTAVNDDAAVLARAKSTVVSQRQAQENNPAAVLQLRVNDINFGGFGPLRTVTATEVAAADPQASVRFYRERLSNAADFTVFLAGNFSVDAVTPLLEKYIASLPSTGPAGRVAAAGTPVFPAAVVRDVVRKGRDPRAEVRLTFFAPSGGDPVREERAAAIAAILKTRVYNRLRGVMGSTYTVNVNAANLGPEFGTITLGFVCAPANVESLTQAAIEEAQLLARQGPTAEEVGIARAARLDELKTRAAQGGYWISLMERARRENRGPASIVVDPAAMVAPITVGGLKEAARQDLPESRFTVVTLLPESP